MLFSPIRRRLALALAALPLAVAAQGAASVRIETEMLDGNTYSLADNRGNITLISLWSPESLASRKCIWELQRFASAYESRGVRTIAASTLNDKDALREFVAKRKLGLPVAILGEHNLGPLDEQRLPLVYVFDRDGRLQATHAGLFSLRVLEQLVAPQLQP